MRVALWLCSHMCISHWHPVYNLPCLQCSIDLKDNVLRFGSSGEALPFLPEHEIPKSVSNRGQVKLGGSDRFNWCAEPLHVTVAWCASRSRMHTQSPSGMSVSDRWPYQPPSPLSLRVLLGSLTDGLTNLHTLLHCLF